MEPLRIANCSGFYGDRRSAPRELLEGGPVDVLTGDYLAELTMLILWRSRGRDPAKGYATSFLAQMEECLGLAVDRGVKVVSNAIRSLGQMYMQAGRSRARHPSHLST